MIRFLLVTVFLAVFLALVLPPAILAGFGFYHGLDVRSGMESASKALLRDDLYYHGNSVAANAIATEPGVVTWAGELESEQLKEASGLAASRLNDDVLFAINDSGNEPRLFALGVNGQHLGAWAINYPSLHDFEDMASFELAGVPYLLIADTGDNLYWRPRVTLLILAEPDITQLSAASLLEPAWSFQMKYPSGYRDVEAVAVDEKEERIYLVSKRRIPPEVFSLPLKPDKKTLVAGRLASLPGIPRPDERDLREDRWNGKYRSSPTAMDINGRRALVVTYKDAYLFTRSIWGNWAGAFVNNPVRIPLPDIYALESGAFSADGDVFYVLGERKKGVGRMGLFRVAL